MSASDYHLLHGSDNQPTSPNGEAFARPLGRSEQYGSGNSIGSFEDNHHILLVHHDNDDDEEGGLDRLAAGAGGDSHSSLLYGGGGHDVWGPTANLNGNGDGRFPSRRHFDSDLSGGSIDGGDPSSFGRHNDAHHNEVLFGHANEHARADPEKRFVEGLLEDNPSTFPPLFEMPSCKIITIIACVFGGIGLACAVPQEIGDKLLAPFGEDIWWPERETIIAYSSIPIVSCGFTYFHIWLALWMMFYPIKFVGVCQIPGTNIGMPGWQGIIPFKAVPMAEMATELMTTKLVNIKDEFKKVNPVMVSAIVQPIVEKDLRVLLPQIMVRHKPKMWNMLPENIKDLVISKSLDQSKQSCKDMMEEIQTCIDELMDIKTLVTDHFANDCTLLNEIFIQCGYQELVFIRNSGATLGFLFGFLQMMIWVFWHPEVEVPLQPTIQGLVVFPVFGLALGLVTNWISLMIIFEPVNPVRLCGPNGCIASEGKSRKEGVLLDAAASTGSQDAEFGEIKAGISSDEHPALSVNDERSGSSVGRAAKKQRKGGWLLHGLFLRRQKEVAAVYSRVTSQKVLTMDRFVHAILTGQSLKDGPKRVQEIFRRHLGGTFDRVIQDQGVLGEIGMRYILTPEEVVALREDIVREMMAVVPNKIKEPRVQAYFDGAIGMERTVREKMESLPYKEFEQLLHPVFQADEWKLIVVGGALGLAIGLLQAYFIN